MKPARMAAPLAALLLFAGCSTPSGATAFTVDGQGVTQRQVDAAAEGCSALAEQPAARIRPQVAQFLLYGELADAISKRTGVEITPAMEAAAMKQVGGQELLSDEECGRAARGVARFAALGSKIDNKKLAQQVRAVDVQVNPVYGGWDAATASLTGTSGSLSRQDLGLGRVFG